MAEATTQQGHAFRPGPFSTQQAYWLGGKRGHRRGLAMGVGGARRSGPRALATLAASSVAL